MNLQAQALNTVNMKLIIWGKAKEILIRINKTMEELGSAAGSAMRN